MINPNPVPSPTGWRRYITGQRLRLFILLSVAAHVIVLSSWGVPAYVKQRREAAREREQMALLARQKAAAEAALAAAKSKAHQQTVADVHKQTRQAFEDLVGDLPTKQKENVWDKVSQKLSPVEDQLAKLLADRNASQQDLDNAQANLNSKLVSTTDAAMTASAGQAEADAFLAAVQNAVLPEMTRFYGGQLADKIGQPLHGQADTFVASSPQQTQAALEALDAQRKLASAALTTLSQQIDAAAVEVRAAQGPTAKTHLAAAGKDLSDGSTATDSADAALAKIADAGKSVLGGGEWADGIAAVRASIADTRKSIKSASDALAAGDVGRAGETLTSASLLQQRLSAQLAAANDAAVRSPATVTVAARSAVVAEAGEPLTDEVQRSFDKAFSVKAADRIAAALGDAFAKRLTAKAITDASLAKSVSAQLRQMLCDHVNTDLSLGTSGTSPLQNYGPASVAPEGDAATALRQKFQAQAKPIIDAGTTAVAEDASDDAKLVELASALPNDDSVADARDRLAAVAANQSAGRSGADAISATDLNDLRAGALLRTAHVDAQNDPDSTDAPPPSTEPAADPTVGAVKKDIVKSLHHDVEKLLAGKLTAEQSEKVWKQVAKDSDSDTTHLAQDVLDNSVSDSELESHRMDFSRKVLSHVQTALDQTAADDVQKDLLNRLNGSAGDQLAGAFRDSVKKNVGQPLAGALSGAAGDQADAAAQHMRDLRTAIDAARDTAGKAAPILDAAHANAENAAKNPATGTKTLADQRDQVAAVAGAIADAQKALADAARSAPIHSQPLEDRLADANKAFQAVADNLKNADTAAKANDAKATADAVAKARAAIDPFRSAVQAAADTSVQDADQARAQFAKAAQTAAADQPNKPGISAEVTDQFNAAFRKDAAPKLADQALAALKQKLAAAGVTAPADDAKLKQQITDALDQRMTSDKMGDTAVGEAQQHGAFDHANEATTQPSAEQVGQAKSVADKVLPKAVKNAIDSSDATHELANALNGLNGPDHSISEAKDRVSRMEGELRGDRGGMLADDADAAADPNAPPSVSALRKKWRSLMAGLGDDGDDANGPGGKHKFTGGGSGGGNGSGSGTGNGMRAGRLGRAAMAGFDEAEYQRRLAELNGRDPNALHGAQWQRHGATGEGSRASADDAIVRPAEIIAPSTQPHGSLQNEQPYKPTFKSYNNAFATIPFLNKRITLDGDLTKWKDIPAIELHPDYYKTPAPGSLHVADALPVKMAWDNHGLYFAIDVTDPDNAIEKSPLKSFYSSDELEIFVDTMNNKQQQRARGAGQQFFFWPFGSADTPPYPGGESLKERYTDYIFTGLTSAQVQVASRRTNHGYTMEICLPTERVRDASLFAGKILGLNFKLETGTSVYYYWSASLKVATYQHPDTWGDVLLAGSDGKLEIPQKLTGEDGPDDSRKTVNAVILGQPLRLRVTDRDMNLNDKVQDKVSVTVRNPRTGDSEVAILTETGPATGIFEGSVRTALDIGEKVPGVVSAYEGETLHVIYLDQSRANGARNVQVTYDVKTASPIATAVSR